MLGRTDYARYLAGVKRLDNWVVLLEGGIRTRYGTRYIATVKDSPQVTVLLPFLPSTTQGYVIEAGNGYFRFYTNTARLESPPGTPVEITTPYASSQLRALRTAQANDVMILAHGSYAPRRLSRLTTTSFRLQTIAFTAPPTFESGFQPVATLTPSATTGTITLTASAAVFLQSDVQRIITAGDARCIVIAFLTTSTLTAIVLESFASTSAIAAGGWTLQGSPVANAQPGLTDVVQIQGSQGTLSLQATTAIGMELVSDGDFSGGQGGWTDLSAPTLVTGTHTGGNNLATLIDDTKNFVTAGVLLGHIVRNTTDGSQGTVLSFSTTTNPNDTITLNPTLSGGSENDFDTGDAYTIRETGSAGFTGGIATLNGGTAGHGWIQRTVTTVVGRAYAIQFDVTTNPLSLQVGSTSATSNLRAEASFPVGNVRTATVIATTTTTYVQFRNNQNNNAAVDNVSVKQLSIDGWRSTDVGRYVRINQGLLRILSFVDATQVTTEVVIALNGTTLALAGAWSLESPSWSDTMGWPSLVLLYEGRLYFAASATFPQTIWGSAVDDLFNFFVGPVADQGVSFTIRDSGGNIVLNQILALMPAENMLAMTSAAEYRLIGAGDDPLSSTSPPRVRVQTTYGAAAVPPLKIGPALLFVQRQGSALRELAFQDTTASFVGRNLSRLARHFFATSQSLQLVYQSEPTPIVWVLREDGVRLGLTYDLAEQVEGWYQHTTQGRVQSLAAIPHPTGRTDQLWSIVQRTVGGNSVQFVEVDDPLTAMRGADGTILWSGLTVDAGVSYAFANPTTALTGLSHLNGTTVVSVGDGAVYPAQVVSGGSLTLPHAVTTAWVGLAYTCSGETLVPEVPLRGQTSQQGKKRWVKVFARVHETLGLQIAGELLPTRTPAMDMGTGVVPFTGDLSVLPPGGWAQGLTLAFVQEQPLPATVLALFGTADLSVE